MRHESEDEDNINPDERNPQSIADKRIAPDNEFSDSEDEGMAPGVGGGGRKDNRLAIVTILILLYPRINDLHDILDPIKQPRLPENKHVWILIGWKLMNLNLIF